MKYNFEMSLFCLASFLMSRLALVVGLMVSMIQSSLRMSAIISSTVAYGPPRFRMSRESSKASSVSALGGWEEMSYAAHGAARGARVNLAGAGRGVKARTNVGVALRSMVVAIIKRISLFVATRAMYHTARVFCKP